MAAILIFGNKVMYLWRVLFDKVCRDHEIRFHLKPPRWVQFELIAIS